MYHHLLKKNFEYQSNNGNVKQTPAPELSPSRIFTLSESVKVLIYWLGNQYTGIFNKIQS